MSAKTEKYCPCILGIVVAGVFLWGWHDKQLPKTITDLLSAVITISAIAVGFLATTKSIMLTMEQKRIVKQLKNIGRYHDVLRYLMAAIDWAFLCALFSAGGLLLNIDATQPKWYIYAFAGWLFLAVTAVSASYRIIRIFYTILCSDD